jgi:hypothetical protein
LLRFVIVVLLVISVAIAGSVGRVVAIVVV